jgi:hypothetical protein
MWSGLLHHQMTRGSMTSIQGRFAVFFGKVDQRREAGWYWTSVPEPGEHPKGAYTGPFETKDEAIEDANQAGVTERGGEIDRR